MRAVADGSIGTIVPQNLRSGGRSGDGDFSTHLRNGRHSSRAEDAAAHKGKSDVQPIEGAAAEKDMSAEVPDTPSDPTQNDSIQWLAAQMLAFKMKEPVETVQADGSVQTTIKTSVVTLPKAALEQGTATADGVPTLDPQTGLLSMKPVTGGSTGGPPASGDLPVSPVETPPTDVIETPPVDVAPVDTPDTPVVDAGGDTPPADVPLDPPVGDTPQDPVVVVTDPATDPSAVDPSTLDPTLVDEPMPTDALPPDDGETLPTEDDGGSEPVTPGVGQSKSANVASTTHAGAGRAGTATADSQGAKQGGDFSGGSQKDSSAPEAAPTLPSPTPASAGVTAPPMQVQLAVPADRQLVPSIGAEIASTAQGMSALERVLQANDQAQASSPVMKVLNVQLSPADLGNVSMRLSLEGNALDVHMSVDQGRTRTLIERDRHMISDSLAKIGYSVSALTIEQTSASSNSDMSSAGQSFTSNNGYDGSSGRQSNQPGNFGGTHGQGRQGLGFMDGDGAPSAIAPARVTTSRGVFV